MKIFNFKSSSILINWSISYVSILLIPLIISVVVYIASGNILEREIAVTNKQLLNQVKNAIDSRLKDIEKIGIELLFNQNIKGLSTQDTSIETIGSYNTVIRDLGVYKISNSYINNLYLYLQGNKCAISANTYLPEKYFYDNLVSYKGVNENQWREILQNKDIPGFIPVLSKEENNLCKVVVYTKPLLIGNSSSSRALLMITIDNLKLLESITSIDWVNKPSILVIDKNNNIVSSNSTREISGLVKYDDLKLNSDIILITKGSEKLTVSYTTSDITNWKYISIIPTSVFSEKTDFIKKLTVVSILLSLLIGFILILVFVKMNYNPLSRLIKILSTGSGLITDKKINEFKFIQDAINRTLDEKEKIQRDVKNQNRILRSNKLVELLKGKIDFNRPVSETLLDFDIRFSSDYFLVMLFHIDEDSGFLTKTDDLKMSLKEKLEMARFVVSNIMEELLCQSQYALATEVDKMVACIINLKDVPEEAILRGYLHNILEKAEETIRGKFNINFKVAISDLKNTVSSLPEAFGEALEMLEYKKFLDIDDSSFVVRTDRKNREGLECQYYYPLQVEQKLINYVKVGDFDNSKKLLDLIYENNLLNSSPPIVIVKCLMFNLISTMLKTLYEISGFCDKSFLEKLDPINRLMNCQTIFDMKKHLANILEEVCLDIEFKRKNDHRQIKDLVIRFVGENYKGVNLNISMIAENLDITPAYLSKLFKEQTGFVLLNFINNLRLEKAKELMKSKKYNISDVASEVGFYNSNTFIRIFKKYEGITPGKYKELNG